MNITGFAAFWFFLAIFVICALIEEYLNYRLIVKRMEKENKNDGQ